MLPLATRLPDAVVRPLPGLLQAPCEPALQLPAPLYRDDPRRATTVRGGEHFARYVTLDLARRVVADTDGRGAFVPGEPGNFVLGQAAGAIYSVHDLGVLGFASDGPEHPLLPGVGFFEQANPYQGTQGERAVAQPAIAIVPVSRAAQGLGERGRGSGHDAAARFVSEALEG